MERIIVKRSYPLLEEGVMFLTKEQERNKEKERKRLEFEEFKSKISSLKRDQYPEGTLFGVAIMNSWEPIDWDYRFLDLESYDEAKEELFKIARDYNYDRVISYTRKPVTEIKEVFV